MCLTSHVDERFQKSEKALFFILQVRTTKIGHLNFINLSQTLTVDKAVIWQ